MGYRAKHLARQHSGGAGMMSNSPCWSACCGAEDHGGQRQAEKRAWMREVEQSGLLDLCEMDLDADEYDTVAEYFRTQADLS
jgi:hypothetical protein